MKSVAQNIAKQSLSASANVTPVGGTGGRSSSSGVVATVFGATGFLGRYVVNALGRVGSQVIIPYRGTDLQYRHLKVMGDLGQIVPLHYSPRSVESIERAVAHSNVVINLIGSQRGTSNFSLDDTNRKIARLVARVARERGTVEQYIHVSDIRASADSPSEYAKIKFRAEQEVQEIFPGAVVLRPAPLFGAEDKLTNAYGVLLRYWRNWVPLIGPDHELQPVYAGDVARVVSSLVLGRHTDDGIAMRGRVVEAVGPDRFTHRELCEAIAQLTLFSGKYRAWEIPSQLAAPVFSVTDKLPRFRPYFSHQEILMRGGRSAVPSHLDERVASVQKGKESLNSIGLLWLRRFREAVSMNQVVGDKHKYDEFFDEDKNKL